MFFNFVRFSGPFGFNNLHDRNDIPIKVKHWFLNPLLKTYSMFPKKQRVNKIPNYERELLLNLSYLFEDYNGLYIVMMAHFCSRTGSTILKYETAKSNSQFIWSSEQKFRCLVFSQIFHEIVMLFYYIIFILIDKFILIQSNKTEYNIPLHIIRF